MNQPMARVVALEYRDMNPHAAMDSSVFVVHIRGPDGDMHEHPLPNPEWLSHNATLQFMALNGIKPSDIDGTYMNVEDWMWLIEAAPTGDGYGIAQSAMSGGEDALEDAEWFSASDDERDSDAAHGPHGGGDGDGGGRGGSRTTDEGGVSLELTPEEDTGAEVTIE